MNAVRARRIRSALEVPATAREEPGRVVDGNAEQLAALSTDAPDPFTSLLRARLARRVARVEADSADNSVMQTVMALPAAGQPLPEAVRARMEAAFGHDFGHVRIRRDGAAASAAEGLQAHAFALGADLYFGAGEWAPGTSVGDRLIAHELTHVVQHDEGRLPTGGGVSSPSDPSEREAYAAERSMATAAAKVEPSVGPSAAARPSRSAVHRSVMRENEPASGSVRLDVDLGEASVAYELEVGAEAATWLAGREPEVERRLRQLFVPEGQPLHETARFLASPALSRPLAEDLRSSAGAGGLALEGVAAFLTARQTTYTESADLQALEDYVESQGVAIPIDWPAVVPSLREVLPFPDDSIVAASDLDRYELFLQQVENAAAGLAVPDHAGTPDAETLAPLVVTYVFDVMTAEQWGVARDWHSELFLAEWLDQLLEVRYAPDTFDLEAFRPTDSAEDVDAERDRVLDEFLLDHGSETVAMYVMDRMALDTTDPERFLADLDFEAMQEDVLDHLVEKFLEFAGEDAALVGALRDHALEQSRFEVLAFLHAAASGQSQRNLALSVKLSEVADWGELDAFEMAIASDPYHYVGQEEQVGAALVAFFDGVSAGGSIEAATVELALASLEAAGDDTTQPGLFLLPQALLFLRDLQSGLDDQAEAARDRIREQALPSYDTIVEIVRNAADFAAAFIEQDWIPMLKTVALERVTANRDALQDALDHWDVHRAQSVARYRLTAGLLEDLAGQLESGEADYIELAGQMITVDEVDELLSAAEVMTASADRLASDDSAEEEKERIQEAIDGYDDVAAGIEDEDPYEPHQYGPSVAAEARERLGIGSFSDPEFTTYGMVLSGEAVAANNPFLARAIVAWQFEEATDISITSVVLFAAAAMLTLASLLVPGAAGLALMALDFAVGMAVAAEGVSDADDLVDMARLDTDLEVYGVSAEQAERALRHAWIGVFLTIALAAGIGALALYMRSGTGTIRGFANIEALMRSNPTLLAELTAMTSDVRSLERLLEAVTDANRVKELLLVGKASDVEALLLRVGNDSDSLLRVLQVADTAAVGKLLDTIPDVAKLAEVLEGARDAARVETLIAELGGERVGNLLSELGGVRLGHFARELDAAKLDAFVTDVGLERIAALESAMTTGQVARAYQGAGEAGIEQLERIRSMQAAGRVRGFEGWAKFTSSKSADDLANTIAELREAERLAAENPTSVINVGGDAKPPTRADDSPMSTFDFTVESPTGEVSRSVEVTSVAKAVGKPDDLTSGVTHGLDKVTSRIVDGEPIPGTKEVVVSIELDADSSMGGGARRLVDPDGNVSIVQPNGMSRSHGNLFDGFVAKLNALKGGRQLDTVVFVGDGRHLARYENVGGTWSRVH